MRGAHTQQDSLGVASGAPRQDSLGVASGAPRYRRKAAWILAIGIVAAGGVMFAQGSRATAAAIDPALVVTATRKALDVDILETGRVVPREKADIKSRVAGQVASVLVREGEHVEKGQVLLELEPRDFARALAKADADLAQAKAWSDFARVRMTRAERGTLEGLISRADHDQASHDLRLRAAALRGAEVARAVAHDQLGYTRITSPIAGTLIARSIEPGETVVPGVQSTFDGKALMTVADLDVLTVKVSLNQIDVAKVSVGRKATVTLDALPGKSYPARVTKVAAASVKLPGKEQDVFPIEALLEESDGQVKPGMTADVRVHLDRREGALAIPIEALVKDGARTYVMRVSGEKKEELRSERVEVTVGLRNDRDVEIASGITEGARVLLRPPSAADNETKL